MVPTRGDKEGVTINLLLDRTQVIPIFGVVPVNLVTIGT